jgi:hypothetical protein
VLITSLHLASAGLLEAGHYHDHVQRDIGEKRSVQRSRKLIILALLAKGCAFVESAAILRLAQHCHRGAPMDSLESTDSTTASELYPSVTVP